MVIKANWKQIGIICEKTATFENNSTESPFPEDKCRLYELESFKRLNLESNAQIESLI